MEKQRIVVLGGSFNPPTKAHVAILEQTVQALNATKGLFVPSSHAYVHRKASRQHPNLLYSEQQRLELLDIICHYHPTLGVLTHEYGDDGRGHTYESLCHIQKRYPNAEIWFILGDDKLRILPRWHQGENLLREFHFAVCCRNQNTIQQAQKTLLANPKTKKYINQFQFITIPPSPISSTQARACILENNWDGLYNLCPTEIWHALQTMKPMQL